MDIPKTLFATLVKQGRMEMHLTQEALAEKLGISAAYLGDLERHKGGPSLELFCKTMQTLNISADDYVYPNQNKNNSTYDQILRLLNQCNDYQLQVILATTVALLNSDTSDVDTTNDTKQNLLNPDNQLIITDILN